jgi:3-deoxy-D-manno-octulosonic-acid transferase
MLCKNIRLFRNGFTTFVPAPKKPEMNIVYTVGIKAYSLLIKISSLFSIKARDWVAGRKNLLETIEKSVAAGEQRIWFHCASLGEFEQGRPVIEAFRAADSNTKIVLTFFSPSGYNIRKNYPGADYVFYLPADTPRNAERFVSAIDPVAAVFVKYEFWANYLLALHKKGIPSLLISGIFRPGQHFFRWYGGFFRGVLRLFSHFYLQDNESAALLEGIGLKNVTVSGDTRFDRVAEIVSKAERVPSAESFAGEERLIVAGSSWPQDEAILSRYLSNNPDRFKLILAPHEVDRQNIDRIIELFGPVAVRLSDYDQEKGSGFGVLVIDRIGILSSLYRYAHFCYIGGGFGKGIHNILEAAAWGKPVVFGPCHNKFREAVELIKLGGAASFGSYEQFAEIVHNWIDCQEEYSQASIMCSSYIAENKGATKLIVAYLINRQPIPAISQES